MGNYYAIKNRFSQNVIDIQGDSTQAGALLDGYPETNPPSDNQLWEFVPDPLGSGYFFIKSKLNGNVIDIQGKSEASGALLDAFPTDAATKAQLETLRVQCGHLMRLNPVGQQDFLTCFEQWKRGKLTL